uniref:Plectin-1 n=1 Tax=Magallana gigas TaxID=29159 RepID=K1PW13_MAGGI
MSTFITLVRDRDSNGAGRRVIDLFDDLRDGHNLISLLEVLAHDTLPREKGRMKFHKIQNVQIALEYLSKKGIRLVNIRSDEIVDGNPKLTLGLIWTIILHFQAFVVLFMGNFTNSEWEIFSVACEITYWSRNNLKDFDGTNLC